MTDRELLELAAKAAGIRWSGVYRSWVVDVNGNESVPWRPLTDDGDALRLAVKLKMTIDPSYTGVFAGVAPICDGDGDGIAYADQEWGADALRRHPPRHRSCCSGYGPIADHRAPIERRCAGA